MYLSSYQTARKTASVGVLHLLWISVPEAPRAPSLALFCPSFSSWCPGDLPDSGIEPTSPESPALLADSLLLSQ